MWKIIINYEEDENSCDIDKSWAELNALWSKLNLNKEINPFFGPEFARCFESVFYDELRQGYPYYIIKSINIDEIIVGVEAMLKYMQSNLEEYKLDEGHLQSILEKFDKLLNDEVSKNNSDVLMTLE